MSLKQRAGENITVSTVAIGPTLATVDVEVIMAEFSHREGGSVFAQSAATPDAAGLAGDFEYTNGDHWRVWGQSDIKTFKMVKRTGHPDASIAVQYFGTGAS